MATISINDFQIITGTGAEDYILLSYNGGQGGKIAIGTFKAQMTPSIKDGKWWIGGVDTNVTAQGTNGKTPIFRRGESGIEYSYEGENSWSLLVPYSELKLNFDDLTEEQKSQLKMTLDDLSAEDIALLQKPATDMIDELESTNEEMQSAKDDAQDTADHPTYVGSDYYVYKWNKGTKVYDKTSIYVKGEKGEKGEKGDKGDKGENGDGSGNVLVDASGLVTGKQYAFTPKQNGSAEGTFVEYVIPDIDTSTLVTDSELTEALKGKQDSIDDLDTIRQGANEANSISKESIRVANNAFNKATHAESVAETAKNAVSTLEGLANATEAQEVLAAQVVQIEDNKQKIASNKAETDAKLFELGQEVNGSVLSKVFNINIGSNALIFNLFNISIKTGDILKFKLIGNVAKYWLGAFGEDGSWKKITDVCVPNEWMFKECLLDVDSFGVWIEAADILESGSAELLFVNYYDSSVEGSIKKHIINVEEIIKSDSYSTSHIRSGVLFTSKTPDNIKDGVYELDIYINDSIYEENKELSLDWLGKYSNGRTYIQCSNSNINIDIPWLNLPNDINYVSNDYAIKGYIDWSVVGEYTKCNAIIKTKPLSSLIAVDLNNYPSINKDRQVKSVSVSQGGQLLSFNIFPLEVKKGEMIRMRVDNIDASVNGNYGIYGFGENGEWVHLGDGTIGQSIITWCLGDATSVGLAIDGASITKSGQIKVSFEKNFDTNSKAIVDIKQSLALVQSYDYRIRSFNDNPLKYIKETSGLTSIFDTWGFIGDSLSSGVIPLSTDTNKAKDLYYYSWGQYMCRLCGSTGTNWSYGGCTTTSWLNSYGINTLNAEKKKGYIIALGTNDCNQNFEIGSKSDVDFSDYNNNGNTFFGNYCKIIQQIKSVQPSAKIFVVALPNWWSSAESKGYNTAIREIATMFENVYLIDLFTYCKNNNYIHNKYLIGGHMNTQGYLWAAYVFCTYIDWIISHYPDEFGNVAYIGSEYDDGNI